MIEDTIFIPKFDVDDRSWKMKGVTENVGQHLPSVTTRMVNCQSFLDRSPVKRQRQWQRQGQRQRKWHGQGKGQRQRKWHGQGKGQRQWQRQRQRQLNNDTNANIRIVNCE